MILITGATGTVGGALVDELGGREDVRALVRDPAAAQRLRERGVEAVVGAFEDPASIRRAASGADRLFLLSPPGAEEMVRAQVAVLEAARAAGVRRVVKLSSIAADEDTSARIVRAHRQIERHVEAVELEWTHLRAHWFMQNELGQAPAIAAEGVFHAPDVGRIAMIDARDVAAAAARALTEPGHERRAYVLTGPAALSYADVAAILSAELGRDVRWNEVSLDDARASMLDSGLPDVLASGFAEIMARYREGGVTAAVSPDAQTLIGRPPRSFAEFVGEHADAFSAPAHAVA